MSVYLCFPGWGAAPRPVPAELACCARVSVFGFGSVRYPSPRGQGHTPAMLADPRHGLSRPAQPRAGINPRRGAGLHCGCQLPGHRTQEMPSWWLWDMPSVLSPWGQAGVLPSGFLPPPPAGLRCHREASPVPCASPLCWASGLVSLSQPPACMAPGALTPGPLSFQVSRCSSVPLPEPLLPLPPHVGFLGVLPWRPSRSASPKYEEGAAPVGSRPPCPPRAPHAPNTARSLLCCPSSGP